MANDHLFKMLSTATVNMDEFRAAMKTYVSHATGGSDEKTLLMEACDWNHVEVVRELVKMYPEQEHLFARDKDEWTVLMYPVWNDRFACMEAILDNIPDPKVRTELICMRTHAHEWTALMDAAYWDSPECAEMLCSAIDDPEKREEMIRMRHKSSQGRTALMIAVERKSADTVKVLLEWCPSAIEDACANDSSQFAEHLIKETDEKTRRVFADFWKNKCGTTTKGISIQQ